MYDEPIITPDDSPFVKFTYHIVAVGNPVSVNVTLYVTFEKVIDSDTGAPLTINILLYDGEYIALSVDMVYVYVPLVRYRLYDEPVIGPELLFVKFTYHVVPFGRPVSVNVTLYVTFEKVIGSFIDFPFTVNEPEDGDGKYVFSVVAIV